MPADDAIASRCNTALVEPPRAMTTVIAFSMDARVTICRGVMPRLIRLTTASPARPQSSRFCPEMASCAELLGKAHSHRLDAEAMVLAVYIPHRLRVRNGVALDEF